MDQKRLKIAFINLTQGVVNRGAETFVKELGKRLHKKYEVEFISGRDQLPARWPLLWRFYLDSQGISVLSFTLKILPKLWREKYDLVIPVNGGWQSFLVRAITWMYRGKMIISGQSGKGWDDRINLWNFPNCFVSLSTQLKNWAKKVNPFIKVVYIPNGVDINKFNPQGKMFSLDLEGPIILCAGALTNEKRIDLAIKAVANLDKASLVVIGVGPLKRKIKNLGEKLLGKRFYLTKLEFSKMPEIYRSCNLFTLPSPWFRSFEIVIVEAMASNLPVVVNDDPIRREIVGEAGFFVDPVDINSYTEAITQALDRKWDSIPRKQAEKFSWDKITNHYEQLIEELCG